MAGNERRKRRPWLIGCGVLLVLAVIAFQALSHFGDVVMQRRSMAMIRSAAAVIEAYESDHKAYPAASTPEELAAAVVPTYARTPTVPEGSNLKVFGDEWGRPIRYQCWQIKPESPGCDAYVLVSAGADGKFEKNNAREYVPGTVKSVDEDLVFSNGRFIRYPRAVE